MEAGMTDHGPDDMGDDEQETELAEYEEYIEDPPDDLVIAEDDDDDAEAATDWADLHPRQLRAEEEEEEEPDDESAEDSAIHVTDEP
jgi:hypothetical protein